MFRSESERENVGGNMESRKIGKLFLHDHLLNRRDPQLFTLTNTRLYYADIPEEEDANEEEEEAAAVTLDPVDVIWFICLEVGALDN